MNSCTWNIKGVIYDLFTVLDNQFCNALSNMNNIYNNRYEDDCYYVFKYLFLFELILLLMIKVFYLSIILTKIFVLFVNNLNEPILKIFSFATNVCINFLF